MSRKNQPAEKKLRTLERALRKGRLPRYFNIIEYVLDRGLAKSKQEAIKLIMEHRIKADSHPLGIRVLDIVEPSKEKPGEYEPTGEKKEIIDPRVPIHFRDSVIVTNLREDE